MTKFENEYIYMDKNLFKPIVKLSYLYTQYITILIILITLSKKLY